MQQLVTVSHSSEHNMLLYRASQVPSSSLSKVSSILSHHRNCIWTGRHKRGQNEHRNVFQSRLRHITLSTTARLSTTAPFICTQQASCTLNPVTHKAKGGCSPQSRVLLQARGLCGRLPLSSRRRELKSDLGARGW